jgi:hypothetical protein
MIRGCINGVWLVLLVGCATSQSLPYHHSEDSATHSTSQFLYLSQVVAICKHTTVIGDGTVQTSYGLGRVRWEQPELDSDTGDRFDVQIAGSLKRVGLSADGNWVVVESQDFDWSTRKPFARIAAVSLRSGNVQSASDIASLQLDIGATPVLTGIRMEAVEIFFDRQLALRLSKSHK